MAILVTMPALVQARPIPAKGRKTNIDAMLPMPVPMTLVTLFTALPQVMSVPAQAPRLLVLVPTIQAYHPIMPVQAPAKGNEINWPALVQEEQPVLMLEILLATSPQAMSVPALAPKLQFPLPITVI